MKQKQIQERLEKKDKVMNVNKKDYEKIKFNDTDFLFMIQRTLKAVSESNLDLIKGNLKYIEKELKKRNKDAP
jgi:hypothetical protein